jgi:hypothetical protein
MSDREFATRKKIDAYRAGDRVLLVAEGENPTPGYVVTIEASPLRIFPQQFDLLRTPPTGIEPQHVTPYRDVAVVRYPPDQDVITVNHAEGSDQITIQPCGPELAGFVRAVAPPAAETLAAGAAPPEATGMSGAMSFDEAFADALANLPQAPVTHPDQMTTVTVVETGALLGGFAGFHHLFVRVQSRTD